MTENVISYVQLLPIPYGVSVVLLKWMDHCLAESKLLLPTSSGTIHNTTVIAGGINNAGV